MKGPLVWSPYTTGSPIFDLPSPLMSQTFEYDTSIVAPPAGHAWSYETPVRILRREGSLAPGAPRKALQFSPSAPSTPSTPVTPQTRTASRIPQAPRASRAQRAQQAQRVFYCRIPDCKETAGSLAEIKAHQVTCTPGAPRKATPQTPQTPQTPATRPGQPAPRVFRCRIRECKETADSLDKIKVHQLACTMYTCDNHWNGCPERGTKVAMLEHSADCQYVRCANWPTCPTIGNPRNMTTHADLCKLYSCAQQGNVNCDFRGDRKEVAVHRLLHKTCAHCDEHIPLEEHPAHEEKCDAQVSCPYCLDDMSCEAEYLVHRSRCLIETKARYGKMVETFGEPFIVKFIKRALPGEEVYREDVPRAVQFMTALLRSCGPSAGTRPAERPARRHSRRQRHSSIPWPTNDVSSELNIQVIEAPPNDWRLAPVSC